MRATKRHVHVLGRCLVVLVRPLYPENLGAVARAMYVTGFERLVLVDPGPLASPDHDQAQRMAVGSAHILAKAQTVTSIDDALAECRYCVGTSARQGQTHVMTPRQVAARLVQLACAEPHLVDGLALVFGGERTGLRKSELRSCHDVCRIPMAGNEPSCNLAQAVMIILYEALVAALAAPRSLPS